MNNSGSKTKSEIAVSIISFPIMALEHSFLMTSRIFGKKTKVVPLPAKKDVTREPAIKSKYVAADAVFSKEIRGEIVYFHQYSNLNGERLIRISMRRNSVKKTIDFTPVISVSQSLPYTVDGALIFIRQHGFSLKAIEPAKPDVLPIQSALEVVIPIKRSEIAEKPMASNSKNKPFRGHITWFGAVDRPAIGDRKGYTTYEMKLRSEDGKIDRGFVGEQLAELVGKLDLKQGHLINLTPLGRQVFFVEENGKMEERKRNEYSIQIIN